VLVSVAVGHKHAVKGNRRRRMSSLHLRAAVYIPGWISESGLISCAANYISGQLAFGRSRTLPAFHRCCHRCTQRCKRQGARKGKGKGLRIHHRRCRKRCGHNGQLFSSFIVRFAELARSEAYADTDITSRLQPFVGHCSMSVQRWVRCMRAE
jgi:hypothetical protein